jgi:hypothetical protein
MSKSPSCARSTCLAPDGSTVSTQSLMRPPLATRLTPPGSSGACRSTRASLHAQASDPRQENPGTADIRSLIEQHVASAGLLRQAPERHSTCAPSCRRPYAVSEETRDVMASPRPSGDQTPKARRAPCRSRRCGRMAGLSPAAIFVREVAPGRAPLTAHFGCDVGLDDHSVAQPFRPHLRTGSVTAAATF